ncbi:MAG: hypothetical protein GXP14_00590 [Gammaproteobacteria bacterium]|nr:hypothetical protein [Gammaproteobacteria bacterium]
MNTSHYIFSSYLKLILLICMMALGGVYSALATASDLDDGIGIDEAIDDSINADRNIEFIVTKAKTKARAAAAAGESSEIEANGVGSINIGTGTNLQGATIINISTNEDAVSISEK